VPQTQALEGGSALLAGFEFGRHSRPYGPDTSAGTFGPGARGMDDGREAGSGTALRNDRTGAR
jgi:hypothetical protein